MKTPIQAQTTPVPGVFILSLDREALRESVRYSARGPTLTERNGKPWVELGTWTYQQTIRVVVTCTLERGAHDSLKEMTGPPEWTWAISEELKATIYRESPRIKARNPERRNEEAGRYAATMLDDEHLEAQREEALGTLAHLIETRIYHHNQLAKRAITQVDKNGSAWCDDESAAHMVETIVAMEHQLQEMRAVLREARNKLALERIASPGENGLPMEIKKAVEQTLRSGAGFYDGWREAQ